MTFALIIAAIGLLALSGVPGFFMPSAGGWGQRLAFFLVALGSLSGLIGVGLFFVQAENVIHLFYWPAAGNALLQIDALSAFFTVPILLVGTLGSLFGLGYWPQPKKPDSASKLQFFWGTLLAGMLLLVISKHALAFLLGWEVMALSAFFLITAEDEHEECRRSGFIYLVATHCGTLILFGMFALWRHAGGSFVFQPLADGVASPLLVNIIFFMAFVGFGLKAGIMPLHFWLPGAHANAPSHVSALLSGVMLKMGIYGLIRMLSLLPLPPALWGWLILLAGIASGLLGVIFALAQHDLKRLLAYHSVENIGIILLGLGLAMLGRSNARPEWIILGLAGALLHVLNHSIFKSLLFMGAGSVLHATHTRQIDQLGGLARRMPLSAAFFLVGAVAICGLPPLNGFISELFIYLGLFRTFLSSADTGLIALVAAPVLAMIGALAVACFVKVYGAVFLGEPRGSAPSSAHEVAKTMLLPMLVLTILCLVIGLAPVLLVSGLERTVAAWLPTTSAFKLTALLPFSGVASLSLVIIGAFALIVFLLLLPKFALIKKVGTWDCGYANPQARMQYTASSFAQSLVGLFAWVLKPRTRGSLVQGLLPEEQTLHTHVDEIVLDRVLLPEFRQVKKIFRWFYRFQQGQTHFYVLYIIVAVMIMMLTLVPIKRLLLSFF
ncbi:MAG: hydrogenase [Deltaproteobacteria bacterium]|nr:hydrogenase [Deltaproteobacteria bacterium]